MKHILLNYLAKYNKANGLDCRIWGSNAIVASMQAATSQGFVKLSSEYSANLLLQRSIPNVTGAEITPLAPDKSLDFLHGERVREKLNPNDMVSVFELRNALCENWLGYSLVSIEGLVYPDASSPYWPLVHTSLADEHSPFSREKAFTYSREAVFLGVGNFDFHNLCHFIYDFLPKLSLASDLSAKLTILIEKPAFEFHEYFLESASRHKDWEFIYLEPGEAMHAKQLFYVNPCHVHPLFKCSSWALDYVRSLRRPLYQGLTVDTNDLLYIKRRTRRLVNEDEILAGLANANIGYTSVFLEDMTTLDKINAFCSHKSILGVYGAGHSYLVFKEDLPLKLVEIYPAGSGSATYGEVTRKIGISHYGVCGERINTSHPNYPDVYLDADSLDHIISCLLS